MKTEIPLHHLNVFFKIGVNFECMVHLFIHYSLSPHNTTLHSGGKQSYYFFSVFCLCILRMENDVAVLTRKLSCVKIIKNCKWNASKYLHNFQATGYSQMLFYTTGITLQNIYFKPRQYCWVLLIFHIANSDSYWSWAILHVIGYKTFMRVLL